MTLNVALPPPIKEGGQDFLQTETFKYMYLTTRMHVNETEDSRAQTPIPPKQTARPLGLTAALYSGGRGSNYAEHIN